MNSIDELGEQVVFDQIISRSITSFEDDTITQIGYGVFGYCLNLSSFSAPNVETIGEYSFQYTPIQSISFPKLTNIGEGAFSSCEQLRDINMPLLSTCGDRAFATCANLEKIVLPSLVKVSEGMFQFCSKLKRVEFSAISDIWNTAFKNCSLLEAVILRQTEKIVWLNSSDAFEGAPNALVYVPDDLVSSYKKADYWSNSKVINRIKPLSELPTEEEET